MGISTHTTRLDAAATREAATQFRTSAERLDTAVVTQLARLRFDGTRAGRSYVDDGDAVRAALTGVADALRRWSRTSAQVAVALGGSVEQYLRADDAAAARLR